MNKKIALLTLLAILATAIMITVTAITFYETPSIRSVKAYAEEKFFEPTTSSNRAELLGEAIGGGWP